jgi:hypothetical protein
VYEIENPNIDKLRRLEILKSGKLLAGALVYISFRNKPQFIEEPRMFPINRISFFIASLISDYLYKLIEEL